MELLVTEEGHGLVIADGSGAHSVEYKIETWLKPGGFRVKRGWISAEHDLLQALVPAAEVFLETVDGTKHHIELTEVCGNRAEVRVPDRVG